MPSPLESREDFAGLIVVHTTDSTPGGQRNRPLLLPTAVGVLLSAVERVLGARAQDEGWLAGGFARFRCGDCGLDRLVPSSCKGRALCASCGGRRMAEPTAHLVDHVFQTCPCDSGF